jgi:hypothetical protein
MRRRRTRIAALSRARRVSSLAFVVVILCSSVALAWSISTNNPGNAITAATLGSPGTPTFTPSGVSPACTSILVSWTAAANANRYKVERTTLGVTTTLAASHTTTSYSDTPGTAFSDQVVSYRITPLYSGSASWTGPVATASYTCGIGEITNVALTTTCNRHVLTWAAASNAVRYDVYRKDGAAAFAQVQADVTGLTWTDSGPFTTGVDYQYKVFGDDGSRDSARDSNIVADAPFNPFRITSVAIVANGSDTIDSGESIVVTFSEPTDGVAPTSNATTVETKRTNPRGIYVAASGPTVGATSMVYIATGAPNYADHTVTGTSGWNAAKTVWTWTSNVGPLTTVTESWNADVTLGTANSTSSSTVVCSDGSTVPVATGFTPTGNF